jgi:nicotinamidase-related amidase
MTQRALLVIDVQNDYFPGGAWALPDAPAALPNIARLVERARKRGDEVVFIRHVTPEGSPVFAEGSEGGKLHAGLDVKPEDPVLPKQHPSAFQETGLNDLLQQHGISEVDVCGFMTQMCCDTTTREAYGRGYAVRLFSDATAARELEVEGQKLAHDTVHRVSLGALARFAKIVKTEEI